MADGYCSILAQQDKCNGLATNIAASHNNSIATGHREISIAQDGEHGISSGGNEAGKAEQQVSGIARAKAVNVLFWTQVISYYALSNMCWQRQQEDDAIGIGVVIESGHFCSQLLFFDFKRVGQGSAAQSDGPARSYQLPACPATSCATRAGR